MDYEKKYREAIEKVEKLRGYSLECNNMIDKLFPELKESEDERIKKAITRILYENYTDAAVIKGVEIAEIVTWLEKQGEKQDYNPYKATIESIAAMVEKYANGDLKDFYDNIKVKCKDAMEYDSTWIEKQGEQKPAWSEEDEKWIDRACMLLDELNHLETFTLAKIPHNLDDIINHLKSLKDRVQPHWKPTEEQMENLEYAINMVDKCCEDSLQSLYNDLKKL